MTDIAHFPRPGQNYPYGAFRGKILHFWCYWWYVQYWLIIVKSGRLKVILSTSMHDSHNGSMVINMFIWWSDLKNNGNHVSGEDPELPVARSFLMGLFMAWLLAWPSSWSRWCSFMMVMIMMIMIIIMMKYKLTNLLSTCLWLHTTLVLHLNPVEKRHLKFDQFDRWKYLYSSSIFEHFFIVLQKTSFSQEEWTFLSDGPSISMIWAGKQK